MRIVGGIVFFFICVDNGFARPIDEEVAKVVFSEANKVRDAALKKDYAVSVEKMHPQLIKKMGGKEKALQRIKREMERMEEQGIKIVHYEVEKPMEIHESRGDLIVFLPTHIIIETPKVKIKGRGYLIASKKKGAEKWVFMDGSGISEKKDLEEFFVELPAEITLPQKESNTIEEE